MPEIKRVKELYNLETLGTRTSAAEILRKIKMDLKAKTEWSGRITKYRFETNGSRTSCITPYETAGVSFHRCGCMPERILNCYKVKLV